MHATIFLAEHGLVMLLSSFFFNDTATTKIYTLSLHDALPISSATTPPWVWSVSAMWASPSPRLSRSEEHTSKLQSRVDLVCRLLLEKKKDNASTSDQLVMLSDIPNGASMLMYV